MAYQKTVWEPREGENLDKFTKLQETADSVILINSPDSITNPGTEISPLRLNHMEDGIGAAHDLIAGEAAERESAIAAEAQTRAEAVQHLLGLINSLMPENLEELPGLLMNIESLLASKAPVNNPVFTGLLRAAIAQSTSYSDVLVAASNGAVYKRPASGLTAAHAATAGAAANKTAASSRIVTAANASALTLATWADLLHTVAYWIRNPPPAPTGIAISAPPATVYAEGEDSGGNGYVVPGSTVGFTATIAPTGALGIIVEWSVTGSPAGYGVAAWEVLPDGSCQVDAGRMFASRPNNVTVLSGSYTVTATIKGTSISASRTVQLTPRPDTKP